MYFNFPNDFSVPVKSVNNLTDNLELESLRKEKYEEIKDEVIEIIEDEIKENNEEEFLNTRGLQGIDEVISNEEFKHLIIDENGINDGCKVTKEDIINEIETKEEDIIEEGLKDIEKKRIWEEIDEEYSENQLAK
ncbi:hypothetical protein [Clostridium taeniosporum]|uniref:Uncharacterized protein n=1 Tax=Clostridium taeniosporum TaxID=394958 RepID=A0A1D7XM96_9CLOT|nr:hypothetical protein [Clostridium taeniosporum]AOR24444.1 hypothetical protein BGI42_12170 [Clostridium taeniosporum]